MPEKKEAKASTAIIAVTVHIYYTYKRKESIQMKRVKRFEKEKLTWHIIAYRFVRTYVNVSFNLKSN